MTRSDSRKKLIRTSVRTLAITGFVGVISVAFAQDSGNRYARLMADVDIITRYNQQIERQLQSQQAEIASLEQQIVQLDTTALDLPPLLQRMYADLEAFVTADVPFLQTERAERIARLRDLMNSVEASQSEKYRRLMEAYQIEMEFGRSMDSYPGALDDGTEADFVRLGRVALMYVSDDLSQMGYWDHEQKQWVSGDDYRRSIEQAKRIATEEEAPDLITVPVPAPAEGERS